MQIIEVGEVIRTFSIKQATEAVESVKEVIGGVDIDTGPAVVYYLHLWNIDRKMLEW